MCHGIGKKNLYQPHVRLLRLFHDGRAIRISAVVTTLDLFNELVHLFDLLLPTTFGHFHVPLEHPLLRHTVGTAHTVKGSEELTIVDLEARVMK